MHLLRVVALALLVAVSLPGLSQETPLSLRAFAVDSPGNGSSGPVRISGTQNHRGIEALEIRAFGKEIKLSPKELRELQGMSANGLLISYENAIPKFGGPQVYVTLFAGVGSRANRALISVQESGYVRVARRP